MDRSDIRKFAKSLVDGTFTDESWNGWINSAIDTISSSLKDALKVTAIVSVDDGGAVIPENVITVNKVFFSEDEESWEKIYKGEEDAERAYYEADGRVMLSWNPLFGSVKILAEGAAPHLENDADKPSFIPAAFHDAIGLYAAVLSQIMDDETEKAAALKGLFDSRMTILTRKTAGNANKGKNLQMKSYLEV
jgi:hypothetical protein